MKIAGILLLIITLSACDNNNSSQIIGSWLTNSCTQLTDSSSNPINVWAKSTYIFNSNGNINFITTTHSDSDCVTEINTADAILVATFADLGPTTTSLGIDATAISIYFSSSPMPITTTGYFKIENNQLCLSQSFHFDAGGFGIGSIDDTEIDYTNCLTRI